MASLVDIERLQKIFGRKGEKIVLVVPGQDPVVLVPLTEYENYSETKKTNTDEVKGKPKIVQTAKPATVASPKSEAPEVVDPLAGGLEDDDQYFPEPL